ncbi:MAG: hypothetical protein ACLFWD_03185 [Anaerolineales bacterium]
MSINQRIALLLVAIWLILFGLSGLGLDMGILVALLALVAGIVLLIAEW